jgi:asparagine synthase (glutamine-hydrolysing)
MADDILVKVDRSSMLTSLEVRAPFLDTAVVEFAFRLPDGVRATRHERKILLRKLGSRLLPKQLDLRRKQGFSIPVDVWARNAWTPLIESARAAGGMLVSTAVLSDWQRRVTTGESAGDRLFSLLFLALWEREHGVTDMVVS